MPAGPRVSSRLPAWPGSWSGRSGACLAVAADVARLVFTAPRGGRLLIGGEFYSDTFHPIVDGHAPEPSSRGHAARPGIRPVLGVASMTPHGLRHSNKVWLDEDGHPRVAVEERMGREARRDVLPLDARHGTQDRCEPGAHVVGACETCDRLPEVRADPFGRRS